MKPSEAPGWRALFGEVADLRALKRAYAALVRTWSPESEPAEFQALRQLYESAVREIEAEARAEEARAAAAQAEPAEGDGDGAGAPDVEAELAWVDARLAELEARGLAAVCGDLEARVREAPSGSAPALFAAVCLAEAGAPDRVAGLLAEVPEPVLPATPGLARQLLQRRPALIDAPAWRRYTERFSDPNARYVLLRAELEALRELERPDAAWALWEEREPETRRADLEAWRTLTFEALRFEGPTRSEAVLDRWMERFGSADLDLPDGVVEGLSRATCDAMAFGRARADPTVPPESLARVEELMHAAPWDRLPMLQTLAADPAWHLWLKVLAASHPGVYSAFLRMLGATTGRDPALAEWPATPGSAAPSARLAALAATAEDRLRRHERFLNRASVVAVAGTLLLFVSMWLIQADQALGGPVGVVGFLAVALPWVAPKRWLTHPSESDRRDFLEICRAEGIWIHELAAETGDDPRLCAAADELLVDPLSDLAVIGPRHVRRSIAEGGSG